MDSFGARSVLKVDGCECEFFALGALSRAGFSVIRLPYALRILLDKEVLRNEDSVQVTRADIEALAG
jgi:hypothetical protein